jgi:hypothetical protein
MTEYRQKEFDKFWDRVEDLLISLVDNHGVAAEINNLGHRITRLEDTRNKQLRDIIKNVLDQTKELIRQFEDTGKWNENLIRNIKTNLLNSDSI